MKKITLLVAVLAAILFASSEASAQVRVRGIGNRVVVAGGGGPRLGGRAFVGGIGNRVVFAGNGFGGFGRFGTVGFNAGFGFRPAFVGGGFGFNSFGINAFAVNPFVNNSVFVQPNFVPSFGVFGASGCNAFGGGAGVGGGNIFVR